MRTPLQRHCMLIALLAAVQAAAVPKLVCDDPVHEFGSKPNTDVVEHSFVLRNTGGKPLDIMHVRTNCGCTVAEPESRTIAPGASTRLPTELRLHGRQGRQNIAIYVQSTDPEQPVLTLRMRGEARSLLSVNPRHVSFGRVSGERSETRLIRVTLNEPLEIELRNVRDVNNAFDVRMRENGRNPSVKTIVVSNRKGLDPGTYRATVELAEKDVPGIITSVAVFLRVLDQLTIMPTEIVVPRGTTGLQRNVIVTEGTVKTFAVRNVQPPLPDIKADVRLLGDRGFNIAITGIDGTRELDGKVLRITTDVPGMTDIAIPFRVIDN